MPYNLKNLSPQGLRQLFTTISDLAHKAELLGAKGPLQYKETNIPGVNKDEQRTILEGLYSQGLIDFSEDHECVWLKDPFGGFYENVHELLHSQLNPKIEKPLYDEASGILYLQGHKIKLKKHDEDTKQNQLLKYIFIVNAKDVGREFDFTEFPFDDVGDKKKNKEICRTACTAINNKIAKETQNKIVDFLEFNTRKYGWLKINPAYLPK